MELLKIVVNKVTEYDIRAMKCFIEKILPDTEIDQEESKKQCIIYKQFCVFPVDPIDYIFFINSKIVLGKSLTEADIDNLIEHNAMYIEIIPLTYFIEEEISNIGELDLDDIETVIRKCVLFSINKMKDKTELQVDRDFHEVITAWKYKGWDENIELVFQGIVDTDRLKFNKIKWKI
ncbi:MAG: hypothetical protein WC438_05780 [Candidatus Pacearchaeota archaeon]|jgi:hypothetical protein